MRVTSSIVRVDVIQKILAHLGLSPQPPTIAPARFRQLFLVWHSKESEHCYVCIFGESEIGGEMRHEWNDSMLIAGPKWSKKPQIDRKSYKDLDFRSLKTLVVFPILLISYYLHITFAQRNQSLISWVFFHTVTKNVAQSCDYWSS